MKSAMRIGRDLTVQVALWDRQHLAGLPVLDGLRGQQDAGDPRNGRSILATWPCVSLGGHP